MGRRSDISGEQQQKIDSKCMQVAIKRKDLDYVFLSTTFAI